MGNPLAIVQGAPGSTPPAPTLIIQAGGPPGPPGQPASQEIGGVREGQPPAAAILFWYQFGSLGGVIDLINSRMLIGTPPADDYVCTITSSDVVIGHWVVLAGDTDGVLSLSQVDFGGFVDLKVAAPLTPDASASDTLIIMALEA